MNSYIWGHLFRTYAKFSKNQHYLAPNSHTCVHIGGKGGEGGLKKNSFPENFEHVLINK